MDPNRCKPQYIVFRIGYNTTKIIADILTAVNKNRTSFILVVSQRLNHPVRFDAALPNYLSRQARTACLIIHNNIYTVTTRQRICHTCHARSKV